MMREAGVDVTGGGASCGGLEGMKGESGREDRSPV